MISNQINLILKSSGKRTKELRRSSGNCHDNGCIGGSDIAPKYDGTDRLTSFVTETQVRSRYYQQSS
jgi:hypothetical protein